MVVLGEAKGGGGGGGRFQKRERGTGLGWTELRSCVNREVGLGSHSISHSSSPSLISYTVSVDVKHQERRRQEVRAQELCEQGGSGPGLSVPCPILPSSLIISSI